MNFVVTPEGLESLVGAELSAVAFVRDYVEFHFEGPVLRALSGPQVHANDGEYVFPDRGSRDALCELIGRVVESVRIMSDEHRHAGVERIEFTVPGAKIVIPLDLDHRTGPEAAHFVPCYPDGRLRVSGMKVW